MATEIDKSIKLVFNEFQKSISEVPLEVYYQTLVADQYTPSGFQFNIKQPGNRALLDCDIWIEYNLQLLELADFEIRGAYSRNPGNTFYPENRNRTALRGGNVMQRALQNVNLQINNQTLNVRPIQWIDVLNRLYVSNDQAEHEFSTSGGRFDEGNHSLRMLAYWAGNHLGGANQTTVEFQTQVPNLWAPVSNNEVGDGNSRADVYWFPFLDQPFPPHTAGADFLCNMYPNFPMNKEFYNPGLENRYYKFSRIVRENLIRDTTATANSNQFDNDTAWNGTASGTVSQKIYNFTIFERLPIPLFKMYSNDEVFGVIPNIVTMQIQGIFSQNFDAMVLRSNQNALAATFAWTQLANEDCKLYLRWFTPPMSMSIPAEISIPYKKIVNWSKAVSLTQLNVLGNDQYNDSVVQEYNVSLEAIPDLLLIYIKYQPAEYNFITPDDYNMEIRELNINIDNASGKVNQIQSIDLYNKWKKLLKHSDSKIIDYTEWRRYCCVAALQPEDYGVRYGPGYSNQTILGVKFTARNWHSIPAIEFAGYEVCGGYDFPHGHVDTTNCELNITSIYYKNRLVLRKDGSASQELTKIAADFDMMRPAEGMGLGQAGNGMLNA